LIEGQKVNDPGLKFLSPLWVEKFKRQKVAIFDRHRQTSDKRHIDVQNFNFVPEFLQNGET